jgi:hypothetical protein
VVVVVEHVFFFFVFKALHSQKVNIMLLAP